MNESIPQRSPGLSPERLAATAPPPPAISLRPKEAQVRSVSGDKASQSRGITPNRRRVTPLGVLKWLALTVICLGSAAYLFQRGTAVEKYHPNWKYVLEATEQSKAKGQNVLILVDKTKKATPVTEVSAPTVDVDQKTTETVKQAVDAKAATAGTEALQKAQNIPVVTDPKSDEPLARQVPVLTPGLNQAIAEGDTKFFHIFMYDCCDEDGDVVELFINNETFAVVPITNQGATLSVPLVPGTLNSIALKGVRDGEGGITVSFETSNGAYFSRVMEVGELQPVGVVAK